MYALVVLVAVLAVVFTQASAVEKIALPSTWEEFSFMSRNSMDTLFDTYSQAFGKKYQDEKERVHRFELFVARAKIIFDWNDAKNAKGRTYLKGINNFSDLAEEERKGFVMPETKADPARAPKSGFRKNSGRKDDRIESKPLVGGGDSKICDLRPYTTSVKDQSSCGSCWSFGTIAAAEASHFLWSMTDSQGVPIPASYNNAWQLSEQQIIECCGAEYDSNGCGGGGVQGPMQCAVDMGTLSSTISTPYLATTANTTCAYKGSQAAAYVDSWHEPCANGDESCLKTYIGGDHCKLFYTTALKTSIEVIDSFYDYASGVYSDPNCPKDIHNHAVAIVGWGTDTSGKDYWIIRNSWGPNWGDSGYILMERGSNMCCVACENLFFQ